tara:strand:+ start:8470 stop:9156 length:687 start_codon:yes stop_codon:yes gene_type:complete
MIVCLIPARKGSKRLKNKNIFNFYGKPMISHSIEVVKDSKIFDEIYVSTNCKKTANIAKKYGAKVPFIRPEKISNDKSTDIDVLKHFLEYNKKKNKKINFICYVYPTNPLLKVITIKNSFNKLVRLNAQKVLTISKYEYPIQRALNINKKGQITFREPKYKNYVSQKLKTFYQDATQLYWYNLKKIKNFNNFEKFKTYGFELKNTDFVDLNDKNDLKKLKIYYKNNML